MQRNAPSRKIMLPILVIMILAIPILPAQAANNQGLEWGVEIGDRFDYDVNLTYHNATYDLTIDQGMYVIIDYLPVIPDNVSTAAQISFLGFTTYYDNGTEMTSVWRDVLMLVPFYLLPIGNWTLITELYDANMPPGEIYQDEAILRTSVTIGDTYSIIEDIFKSDGSLAYLRWQWERTFPAASIDLTLIQEGYSVPTETTTGTTTGTNTGSTSTPPPVEMDTTLLLTIGVVAAGILIVAVAVCMRRR